MTTSMAPFGFKVTPWMQRVSPDATSPPFLLQLNANVEPGALVVAVLESQPQMGAAQDRKLTVGLPGAAVQVPASFRRFPPLKLTAGESLYAWRRRQLVRRD